nr:MAG TPA: hypothetical protein [Caudoviricetes sp.]
MQLNARRFIFFKQSKTTVRFTLFFCAIMQVKDGMSL